MDSFWNLLATYAGARAPGKRYEVPVQSGACAGEVGADPAVGIEFEGVFVVEWGQMDEVAGHAYRSLLYGSSALE